MEPPLLLLTKGKSMILLRTLTVGLCAVFAALIVALVVALVVALGATISMAFFYGLLFTAAVLGGGAGANLRR